MSRRYKRPYTKYFIWELVCTLQNVGKIMIITLKNLYVNNKCRFCDVKPGDKHWLVYHGFRDMMGIDELDIKYIKDE